MVESQPSKLLVAGSIPVSRSIRLRSTGARARCRAEASVGATGRDGMFVGGVTGLTMDGQRATDQRASRAEARAVFFAIASEGGPM